MGKKLPNKPLDFRVALIAAQWHEELVTVATGSCSAELAKLGVATDNNVKLFKVPGSLEIPLVSKLIIENGGFDAVIAFGLIVDGGIYRHEFVAQTVLDGMMNVSLETKIPVLSAVLTPQKFDEHDTKHIEFFRRHLATKGIEVARAAVQTMQVARLLRATQTNND